MELLFFIFTLVFLVIIISNQFFKKSTKTYIMFAAILGVGLAMYGHAYFVLGGKDLLSIVTSIIRTIRAALLMFGGRDSFSDVKDVELFKTPVSITVFWLVHLLAQMTTIVVILVNFGRTLLLHLSNFIYSIFIKKEYAIFYKLNKTSNKLIGRIQNSGERRIIILDKDSGDEKKLTEVFEKIVLSKKCILLGENIKNRIIQNVFKDAHQGKCIVKLYIVNDDCEDNKNFLSKVNECLKNCGYNKNIYVTILVDDNVNLSDIEKDNNFEYIRQFDFNEIFARIIVKEYPPCKYINFKNCKAQNSFHSLNMGFGWLGQKIFKRQFVYGQFIYGKFCADIFDPDYDNISAKFESDFDFYFDAKINPKYNYLNKNIKINIHNSSSKGSEYFKYIKKNMSKLNQVAIATGSGKINSEMVNLVLDLRHKYNGNCDIFDIRDDKIYVYEAGCFERKTIEVYDYIIDDSIDLAGKMINYAYALKNPDDIFDIDANDERIDMKWRECSAYGKNSSISAAEFYRTILKIAGKNISEDVAYYINNLPKSQKDILGELEHNRWSAYLLTEGYRVMPYDENNGKSKDEEKMLHACLIPWEDLDELNNKIEKKTGESPRYKEKDLKNILMYVRIAEKLNKQ